MVSGFRTRKDDMSKHVLYDQSETVERMTHEFTEGINALDSLLAEARDALDTLTAMQFQDQRRPVTDVPLPTAADHQAADDLAGKLAGRKRK